MHYILSGKETIPEGFIRIDVAGLQNILKSRNTLVIDEDMSYSGLLALSQLDYDLLGTLICIRPNMKHCESIDYDAIYRRVMFRGVIGSQTVAIWLHGECIDDDIKGWYDSRIRMIDSHAHIVSDALYSQLPDIVGDVRVNVICGSLVEVERALLLDDSYDVSIGVHPGSVTDVSQDEFEAMMSYMNHQKVIAVGELGLDYYWETDTKARQIEVLKRQIVIANRFGLPIVVHVRESIEDVYEILKAHPVRATGVIHCFTYDVSWAQKFVDLGYYIGVGGIVTFKNGQNVRDVVDNIPVDRLLLETDSPYLAPVPMRGKENRPMYVSYVYEAVSKQLGIEMPELLLLLSENYKRCFRKA